MERSQTELQNSYNRVAAEYAKRFYDELDFTNISHRSANPSPQRMVRSESYSRLSLF